MNPAPAARSLLSAVRLRMRAASTARRAGWALLALGTTYLAALVATRLLGLGPDILKPWMVAALVPAAMLLGLLAHRRHSLTDAARRADEAAGTKELFLSAVLAESSGGEYAPLVARAAEERAVRLRARQLAPFAPGRPLAAAALGLLLLTLGTAYLPRLDPFQRAASEGVLAKLKEELAEQKKALELRKVEMAKPEEGLSQEVKRSLDKLKQTLDGLQPEATNDNQKALAEKQREFGELWGKLNDEDLREAMQSAADKQKFGLESAKTQKWKEELGEGATEALQQELKELAKLAEELAKAPDGAKKDALSEELKQRMRELENFAKQNLGESPLGKQMAQARSQLQAAQIEQLAEAAMQTLQEQLQMSAEDLQSLAEALQNLQKVEDALKTLQQAQQCNKSGQCDGGKTGGFQNLEEYAKWYQQKLAAMAQGDGEGKGKGKGEGMKGPGTGEGGLAQDDPEAKSAFTPEKNPGHIGAGKILMEWKTKEQAPTGAAREEYARNIRALKQDVSEAILEEKIPPGYHEAIQHYFDRLPEPAPATAPKSQDL